MKNKGIVIFLIVLGLGIVAIIAVEFISNRPDNRSGNPFEYSVEEFKNVPDELIAYKETRNFNIGFEEPAGIAVANSRIYLAGDRSLKIIDFSGNLLLEITLSGAPKTVEIFNENIYLVVDNKILIYDSAGNLLKEWAHPGENSIITSIAAADSFVFVADAGNRRILKYSNEGELTGQFEGKANAEQLHGFIIPSPYFDIDINNYNDFWAVNPGLHRLENYTFDGEMRGFWETSGVKLEGFSGCCNPAHFTFLDDGRFVTSEKGLVRIKIYKPSGEFEAVVAAPKRFTDEGEAPDIATDSTGKVYALDFDKKIVRVFEPKTNPKGV
ncbi:MAG TPA: hypothetical protein VKA10_10665 [Prolixibacteraceae bacterium]|nr:hypothetical protein [Prolixibacteraceae bacterium]